MSAPVVASTEAEAATISSSFEKLGIPRIVVFASSMVIVGMVALLDGSYDIVTRQEFGLLVWWLLGLGVATGLLSWKRGWLLWAPVGGLVLLGAWTAISLDWSESSENTVAEIARITGYVGLLLFVLLAVQPTTSRAAIGGAATAAVAICVLAVGDRLTGSTLSNLDVINQTGGSRLSYPLNYWNAMGTWAAMTVALALSASVHERRVAIRAVAVAAVPIAAATAYLTYSRTSVFGVVLGIAVVLIGSRRRWTAIVHLVIAGAASAAVLLAIRNYPEIANGTGAKGGLAVAIVLGATALVAGAAVAVLARTKLDQVRLAKSAGKAAGVTLGLVAVVGAGVALATAYPTIERQFNNRDIAAASANDPASRLTSLNGNRTKVWSSALAAFEANPATGVGAGAFELWWNRDARNAEFVRDAHSIYLEALAELGVPGLLFVLLFAGSLFALVLVSRWRAPPGNREAGARLGALAVVAVFVVSAGVDWFWESTALTALVLIFAGASGAALAGDRRVVGVPVRIVVAMVAVVACIIELPGLVSTSQVRNSQAAVGRGDISAAIADAQSARNAAPWAASPIVQQALIAESLGEYDTAQQLLTLAIAKEPTNFRHEVLLARVAAENGDLRLARAAFQRARELRPLSPLFPAAGPDPSAAAASDRKEGK